MSEIKMLNVGSLPSIPWQDRPADLKTETPVWRYSENPVLGRNPTPEIARIFNSAVAPWQDGFIAVLRGEQVNGIPHVYLGHSKDGIHWEVDREKVPFTDEKGEPMLPHYAYDPRLVKVEDTYYIIWCTDFYGAAIGMGKTKDFKTFTRLENPFIPFNRNAVLFPRKINGTFRLFSRPSDSGHTPFGDIFLSESPDMVYWGKHRHVMGSGGEWWQGGAILDINEPSKVLYRCSNYLLTPEEPYEVSGFVPNVVFPCATLQDGDTGRIAIYYGAADTHVGLAFTTVDAVVNYIKDHSVLHYGDDEAKHNY